LGIGALFLLRVYIERSRAGTPQSLGLNRRIASIRGAFPDFCRNKKSRCVVDRNISITLPRMLKHDRCEKQVMVHLTPALREALERAASDEGRSISNMARRLLETAVAERELEIHT
jgi:hypothetical protein